VSEGIVTSTGVGRAKITARYGGQSYSCDVLVTRTSVGRALVLSDTELTLDYLAGETHQISASLKENGQEIPADIVFESADPRIVTVSQDGLITPASRGSAMVSAFCIHKGQKFSRSLLVKSVAYTALDAEFTLPSSSHPGTSLTEYDDSENGYFANPKKSYRYVCEGGEDSRLFVANAFEGGKPRGDRLLFQIKFDEVPSGAMRFALGSKQKTHRANQELLTSHTDFLFFDYKGRIADGVRVSKNYYVVASLKDATPGDHYGFYFDLPTSCYVSTPIFCSDDYLFELQGFEKPYELPKLSYCYAETRLGLPLGSEPVDGIEGPYYVMKPTGSPTWDDNAWENRVCIGGMPFSDFRKFNYFHYEVMFQDANFSQMVFWTGGYAFYIDNSMRMYSSETGSFQEDDLTVLREETPLKEGDKILPNVRYTFLVRIQKKDSENMAFGFNVIAAGEANIYCANPSLGLI
ncbi:MAG: hypothetical protein SPI58_05860, partial [Candidatus Enteromonas sp.]|nr:hypothetical protein [Candidatus Enteromonas sp.]